MDAQSHSASSRPFFVDTKFSRNLGWLTADEQRHLATLRVGLLGVGGVGGQYAELLARTGVTQFTIWDPDSFASENTNRQNECRSSTYGRKKVDVIAKLILDINPEAMIKAIARPIQNDDLDEFCRSIDFYFDGLDFFAVDIRIEVFRRLRKFGIPAITAAPVGTGASCLVFTNNSMSFDNYFGLHTTADHVQRSILFLSGLTPSLMQRTYLVAPEYTQLADRRVPSLGVGATTAASLAVTTFMKFALKRGAVPLAPWSTHFDPYLLKLRRKYTWFGYRNPLQALKRWIANRILKIQPPKD